MLVKYLIGLSGHLESGKNTVAEILGEYGYQRFAFGDHIRQELAHWWTCPPSNNPLIPDGVKRTLYLIQSEERMRKAIFQKPTTPEIREAIQWWGREKCWLDPGYWIKKVWADIASKDCKTGRVVISDVRMPNEFQAIKAKGGEVWRIQREPIVTPFMSHVTEHALDLHDFDAVISNTKWIGDLKQLVVAVLRDYDKGVKC